MVYILYKSFCFIHTENMYLLLYLRLIFCHRYFFSLDLWVTKKVPSPRLLVLYEIFMVGPTWYNKLVTSESDMDIDTLAGLGMEQMSLEVSCSSFFDRMQYLFISYFLKVRALAYSISGETSFSSRDSSVKDFR